MPKIRHTLFLAAMLCALALPASALGANKVFDAIEDCSDDSVLQGKYSNAVLRKALKELPTDLRDYGDCQDLLTAALTGGPGSERRGGASALPPSNPALVTETGAQAGAQQDIDDLRRNAAETAKNPKLQIAGRDITPGEGGVFDRAGSTDANVLPLPLLLSLIALAAMCALAGLLALRRQWPATRRVALRVFRR